jgi:hypothetical protein
MYCGAFSEISQPLLLMGMKTPISMWCSPLSDAGRSGLFLRSEATDVP